VESNAETATLLARNRYKVKGVNKAKRLTFDIYILSHRYRLRQFNTRRKKPLTSCVCGAIMSEDIKKRIIRIIINLGALALILTASGLSIPGIIALLSILPTSGLSVGSFLMLILVIISTFLALRVLLDALKLVDLGSDLLVKHIPGLNDRKRISIIRALKEVIIAFLLVLLSTAATPILLLIPSIGPWLSFGMSIIVLVTSLALIYDAGKTLYAIFESWIQLIIDRLAGSEGRKQTPEKREKVAELSYVS